MRRRLLMAVGMSLLLVAALTPGAVSAASPQRFTRLDMDKYPVKPELVKQLRELRNPNRKVMVFVELTRPSVAAGIAARVDAGLSVSEAAKDELRRPLREQQAAVEREINRLNGRVHGTFTDVLNGFRATVPAGKIAALAQSAGVKAIHPVAKMVRSNDNSARYTKAAKTWKQTGFTGTGVKIAIIDSGINYYHHDFAGTGEPENTNDNPNIVEPGTFPTAKVVAGWDFVGDLYDADTVDTATPDPDPMDCNGHGTHVAGTAAGFGVTADGSTYTGPYNPTALNNTNWNVPPGMAPRALLMAYKVFGCEGGTYVVLDAIERAVRDGARVINMSLGLDYGNGGRIEEIATNNAVRAGVTVVASAGNSGPSAYITGSPSTADGAISVAALDADPSFPSVWIDMPTGADIRGMNANGDTDNFPVTGTLNHFEDNLATPCNTSTGVGCEHLGSSAADYAFNGFVAGQIAITHRGITARIDRAIQGDAHGAAAVIMINNDPGFPPFEGKIEGVDIPFIGVPSTVETRFHTDDGGSATITEAADLANPGYKDPAPFTSGGFRRYDQAIKPDVIAPGVSVISANTNNVEGGVSFSGTSMSAPAVAGIAALVRQARPTLNPRQIKALIVGTATTGNVNTEDLRMIGAGAADALRATRSLAHVTIDNPQDRNEDNFQASLSFGLAEIVKTSSTQALNSTRSFRIWNRSNSAITYKISNDWATPSMGLNVNVSPSTVTVPARSNRLVTVNVTMTNAEAGALPDAAPGHGPVIDFATFTTPLEYIGGRLLLKPTVTKTGVMTLRVPWNVVARGISNVWPTLGSYTEDGSLARNKVTLRNGGNHDGIGDFFAWGLTDQQEGYDGMDIRAVGVQSLPTEVCTGLSDADDACLIFALNNWTRFSNPSENLWVIPIDTNEDGNDDYELYGLDAQLVFGALEGLFISLVYDITLDEVVDVFIAVGPTNGSTILLPALASDFGLHPEGDTDFEYYALGFDFWDDGEDPGNPVEHVDIALTGSHPDAGSVVAHYDAFDHAISNGHFVSLDPGDVVKVDVYVDRATYSPLNGHKGWMIVTLEDLSGPRQADLLLVGNPPD